MSAVNTFCSAVSAPLLIQHALKLKTKHSFVPWDLGSLIQTQTESNRFLYA